MSSRPHRRTYQAAPTREASSHPDDIDVAPLPDWLLALLKPDSRARDSTAPRQTAEMHPLEIAELQSALLTFHQTIATWVQTGMALHATGDDANGFQLWHNWSSTSTKYQGEADCQKTWASFHDKPDGVTVASIYQRATKATGSDRRSRRWRRLPALSCRLLGTVPNASARSYTSRRSTPIRGSSAFPLPGQLATIADWSLSTAPHPAHEYATVAALALGSTLCARRYATDMGNFRASTFGRW